MKNQRLGNQKKSNFGRPKLLERKIAEIEMKRSKTRETQTGNVLKELSFLSDRRISWEIKKIGKNGTKNKKGICKNMIEGIDRFYT